MERAAIEQRSHAGLRPGLSEHVEMLLGASVLSGEAEKLEEKRAPLGVGRVVPNLGTQGVDCRIQLPRLKELPRLHAKRRDLQLGVLLETPPRDDGGARRAVGLLRRVRHVHRAEREGDGFGRRVVAAARPRPLNRFHEHFGEVVLEIADRPVAGRPCSTRARPWEVFPLAARLEEPGTRGSVFFMKLKLLIVDLAGTRASAAVPTVVGFEAPKLNE